MKICKRVLFVVILVMFFGVKEVKADYYKDYNVCDIIDNSWIVYGQQDNKLNVIAKQSSSYVIGKVDFSRTEDGNKCLLIPHQIISDFPSDSDDRENALRELMGTCPRLIEDIYVNNGMCYFKDYKYESIYNVLNQYYSFNGNNIVDCDRAESLELICGVRDTKTIDRPIIKDPSSVTLDVNEISLTKGETYDIKPHLNITYVKDDAKDVIYSSSDPDSISVSQDGIITVNEIKDATITVKSTINEMQATLKVNTYLIGPGPLPEDDIEKSISIYKGDEITLSEYDYDFNIITGNNVIEKINKNTFKGISVGTGEIQTIVTDTSQKIKIHINVLAKTVYDQDQMIILKKGTEHTFSNINSLGGLTWKSSDSNIASVDNNGKVKGVSTGIVTITATKQGYEYNNKVFVYEANVKKENIENGSIINGEVGKKITMGLGSTYTWISSDSSIATIDNNGIVTLLKQGNVIILGQKDNNYYAQEINVYNKKESSSGDGLSNDQVMDAKAEFKITPIDETNENYSNIKKKFEKIQKIKVYDIGYYLNDKKIQPNGEVILELNVPENYDSNKISVFRIEDNGTITKLFSKIVGNKIQVTTTHFSYYVIAETDENTAYEIVKEAEEKLNVDNPPTGLLNATIIIILGSLLSIAIYLLTKKKSKFIRL